MARFQDLPDEVLTEIFSYLHFLDLLECVDVCDRWKAVLQHARPWKRKIFESDYIEVLDHVIRLVKIMPQVKELCIGLCGRFYVQLTCTRVTYYSNVGREDLKRTIQNSKIDSITLPKCLFHPKFATLFKDGRKLRSLVVLPDCVNGEPSDKILRALTKQGTLSEAKVLTLYTARTIKNDTLLELCKGSPLLEELSIYSALALTHDGLQNLNVCTNLRVLTLADSDGIMNLSFLQQCPNLERFHITLCEDFDRSSFSCVLLLKKLKVFVCRHSFLKGLDVTSMAKELKHLEEFDLCCSYGLDKSQVQELKIIAPHITVIGGVTKNDPPESKLQYRLASENSGIYTLLDLDVKVPFYV